MPREVKKSEESVAFKAQMTGPSAVFKVSDDGGDRFIIWGKASVEVVDKENDKITADALKDALPQLLRRKRLSLEHTDQLVGDIIDEFETEEPTTVEIDGDTYERSVFPTDVLKLDDDEPPALFVAGEVWDDTRQAEKVREEIENGIIDSYSISGEAIKTATKVEDGEAYDEITELDLSAVTLCEEGMNHKAKFGTVVKRVGDDSVSPVDLGKTSTRNAVTAKSNMGEETPDDGDPDGLDKSDLREEFQKAAQEAIEEADFVTAKDVENIVDQRLEREDDESDDEPSNASEEAGDDMESQKSEEADEKAEEGEDAEKEGDRAYPDDDDEEDEKAVDEQDAIEAAQTIEAFLEAADDEDDDDEGAMDAVDPDEVEDPDDDGEEEVDLDPDEDDEMPLEGDEEEKGDLVSQLEAEGVPDDLCEAVGEHLDGGDDEVDPAEEGGPDEDDEEMVEMEDDGDMDEAAKEKSNTPISDADLDSDLGKASTDSEYLDMTASAAVPETDEDEDLRKSFEHTDNEVNSTPGTLDAFYESMGEDT